MATQAVHATRGRILVVDDEAAVRDSLREWLRKDGHDVDTAQDASAALEALQANEAAYDVVLLDIKMPGMDGMELQERIHSFAPEVVIVMITAYAAVDTAVRALKSGAFDYLTKPFDPDQLSRLVANALQHARLLRENIQLRSSLGEGVPRWEIVGESSAMRQVFELVRNVAPTDATVLLRGESGTGKELVARAIHAHSRRRYFPLVAVNCGALAEGILESELFGHERGAFTGAHYRRKGKLEMADGGTLFLDEIGNIAMKTQMDLLRALETKSFTRLGGTENVHTDFRVVCATNRDLEKAVAEGEFREELYYRINVFSIQLPPLRERRGDIPLLVEHFVEHFALAMAKPVREVSPEALDLLVRHAWPGNVRELENAVERAMVVGKPPRLEAADFSLRLDEAPRSRSSEESLEKMEEVHIRDILDRHHWNITHAAAALGINRVTLYSKIRRYGLRRT
jgi:two-component system, NtrC family, response regulator HydG